MFAVIQYISENILYLIRVEIWDLMVWQFKLGNVFDWRAIMVRII